MTEFPSLRRLNVSYTLVHVVYWAMFAIFAGYQTSLLLGRGFTSGEAGIFASIRCFAGILAQPLLGGWADRHPEVPIKRLLNACLVLALCCFANKLRKFFKQSAKKKRRLKGF